jgi:hypothetical protein
MTEDFNSIFNELYDDIIKKIHEEIEQKALAKVLENERTLLLTDCGIIAHPKYKGVLPQVLELLEVKVPVVWSGMVEEQKIYLVTDEWLVQRMKEVEKGYFDALLEANENKNRGNKRGKWIEEPNCWLRCSCCGAHYPHTSLYTSSIGSNYCPNCGAEMEK